MNYEWNMNNVRELENIIERMIIQCDGDALTPDHIPLDIRRENTISNNAGGKSFQELKEGFGKIYPSECSPGERLAYNQYCKSSWYR
jgi:DNA-binding NtrC family response regulator